MLKDCIRVFNKQLEKDKNLILKGYMPTDGTYVILQPNGESFDVKDIVNIKYNKKTEELEGRSNIHFNDLCFYDYNSKLIDMNKPIDKNKIIHSNNYLSFYIKKESLANEKFTREVIEEYYRLLLNPYEKYNKKKNAREIYEQIELEIGKVDEIRLDKVKNWIIQNIFNLPFEVSGKDYLKIFFEYSKEDYEREGKRYLIPNIYNNNDFNISIGNEIYGMPNDNIGLNSKKPYLENKTRKSKVPYLLSTKDVLEQRTFFDYLTNCAAKGYVNIYIDDEIKAYKSNELPKDFKSGIYLRLQKGKEVEIHNQDVITEFNPNLKKKFKYTNYLNLDSKGTSLENYKIYKDKASMQTLINEVIFSKYLISNYFTEAKDIKINNSILKSCLLNSRNAIFDWLYKGANNGICNILEDTLTLIIRGNILENNFKKAAHQFNFKCSIKEYREDIGMADKLLNITESLRKKIRNKDTDSIESDEEYYFAMGQVVSYLFSRSKSGKRMQSLVNPFLNAKNDRTIKEKLSLLYKKYNYDIDLSNIRFKNLYCMVKGYIPEGQYNKDMFEAGFLHSNLIYEGNKEEK